MTIAEDECILMVCILIIVHGEILRFWNNGESAPHACSRRAG